jgi:hypothetical protein
MEQWNGHLVLHNKEIAYPHPPVLGAALRAPDMNTATDNLIPSFYDLGRRPSHAVPGLLTTELRQYQ